MEQYKFDMVTDQLFENGESIGFVNTQTGKYDKGKYMRVPSSVEIETRESKEYKRILAEKIARKKMRNKDQRDRGNYFFVESKDRSDILLPQNCARLMFVATFMRYEDRKLVNTDRKLITKNTLQEIMRLQKSTFYYFWDEVYGKYLFEDKHDGNTIYMSKDFFRGKIKSHGKQYNQVYIDNLRKIYYSVPPRRHVYLGYIFNILPYINLTYNAICTNPDEKNYQLIKFINIKELCRIIKYDAKNYKRIIDVYNNMIVDAQGKRIPFLTVATFDSKFDNCKMFVNPYVMYNGSKDTFEWLVDKLSLLYGDMTEHGKITDISIKASSC